MTHEVDRRDLHDVRLRPGIQLTGLEVNRRGQASRMTLVPLYTLFGERCVVYWNVSRSGIGNG
jgi:hypothetical protein